MKWDDLRYLLAVTRSGGVGAGAKQLGVHPTTVLRRLRALQSDAGSALFEQLTHGISLTQAGQDALGVAEAMESLTNELDARIAGGDAKLDGSVRVTSTAMLLKLFAPDLASFRRKYAGIELELISSPDVANLTRREVDVALRISHAPPEHLIGRKYAELGFGVYGSRELIKEVGGSEDLSDYPWVGWDWSVGRTTDNYVAANASGAAIVMRASDMPVMLALLEAGVGINVLPTVVGDSSPLLRRLSPVTRGGGHLWILTHAQLRSSARVKAFVEHMRSAIADKRYLLEGTGRT